MWGGEVSVRGNVSHGDGMWKSVDGGKTWRSMGLKDTLHIPRIRIHPKNPDLVYVAALGHLFGPNEERGVFRTRDGGETWEKILYINDKVGAVDLAMDPVNPRILYAGTWRVLRTPYSLESGGEGSGLWKSTDGGDNWIGDHPQKRLAPGTGGHNRRNGLARRSRPALGHHRGPDGGVFRSDDAGETWTRINEERSLRQRGLVLHPDLRRHPGPGYGLRPERAVRKSKTAGKHSHPSEHHTAIIMTCGSRPKIRNG